ncbi:MAG: 2-dehydropantoate 2-reductase [Oscillospiraceae bacterium]|nr:2-dehydropantoate 2-reductase [Oscillospiraceae bacterium]MDY3937224.1 2-dehydropantoate 2-reductase [Oscillospiraceae bacterium]
MMKTAIYGAGSLGTVLGAYISKAGYPVDLITRNKEHVDAMNKNGAHIIGTVDMIVPVHALTPDRITEKYELIFLMTKQLENKKILEGLKDNMTDDCIVCTMQNGLPELSVSEVVGVDRTMGCSVAWGATLHGKGVSELTSEPDSMTFGLGRMNGKKDDKLMEVKKILELMCPVEIEDNFMGVRWSKLLINSAFSGMSAVMGGTFGDAAERKDSRVCCQNIIKEVIDVANAAGIKIEPVQGKDIVKLLYYKGNGIKKKISNFLIPICIKKHRLLKASMLQDLEKGRKCEIDAINGVVCAYGRKYRVPTPYNDKVCEIVHGIEDGKYTYSFENVKMFASLGK